MLQHTPLAVTLAPPLFVILPPPEADEDVIPVITVVEIVGRAASVVNETCSPYDVPALLVA